MSQDPAPSAELPPLQKHPVYIEARAHLDAGQWQQALELLELLQTVYPDNAEVDELLNQLQMRATMARFQPRDNSKNKKSLSFRWVMAGTLTLIIAAVVAYGAYEFWVNPVLLKELRVRQVTTLRNKADEAMAAGNYAQARQHLQQLQEILPQDPETTEALQRVERVEKLSNLYNQAKAEMDAGNWDQALELLTKLQSLDAQYRDLPQLLQTAQESQALEEQFQAAEESFANNDWAAALEQYQALHQANLTFRFDEIQARLFESHLRYGQLILAEANNNPQQVDRALSQFLEALAFNPTDAEALEERRLAEAYLTVLNIQDQDKIIELLQTIYNEQPDYAGHAAAQLLYANLLERADAFLDRGNEEAAIADYQAAVQLAIDDTSTAQEKLTQLISENSP